METRSSYPCFLCNKLVSPGYPHICNEEELHTFECPICGEDVDFGNKEHEEDCGAPDIMQVSSLCNKATSKHKQIREERGKLYGDPKVQGIELGKMWGALIRSYFQNEIEDLPPHLVYLMLSALKLRRAAMPFKYQADDYIDMRNYADFAEEADPGNVRKDS